MERPDVTDDYVCLSFQAIPEAEREGASGGANVRAMLLSTRGEEH